MWPYWCPNRDPAAKSCRQGVTRHAGLLNCRTSGRLARTKIADNCATAATQTIREPASLGERAQHFVGCLHVVQVVEHGQEFLEQGQVVTAESGVVPGDKLDFVDVEFDLALIDVADIALSLILYGSGNGIF